MFTITPRQIPTSQYSPVFERERDKEERDNVYVEKMSFISRMNPVSAVLRRMAGTSTTATRYILSVQEVASWTDSITIISNISLVKNRITVFPRRSNLIYIETLNLLYKKDNYFLDRQYLL